MDQHAEGRLKVEEGSGWRHGASLLLLLLLVACYHVFTIDIQPLFVDEVSELAIAQLTLAEIVAKPDSMPPGHSLLLKAWLALFGVEQARYLSALCGLGTIAASWYFTRRLVDRRTALVVAAVVALLPLNLYYSQFVRGYALFTLLATLAIGSLTLAWRDNRRRDAALFVMASVAGLYVHYYFALVLGPLIAIHLVASRGRILPKLAILLPVILLASLPLLWVAGADFQYQRNLREPRPFDLGAAAYTYFAYFSGHSLGPSVAELHTLPRGEAARELLPWGCLLLATSLPLLWAGYRHLHRVGLARGTVAIWVASWGLVAMFGWLASITFNPRFLAWFAVPLSFLLGSGIVAAYRQWWGRVIIGGLLVLCLLANYRHQFDPRYRHEDFRAAAQYVADHAESGDVVLLLSDYFDRTLDHYLPDSIPFVVLPVPGESNHSVDMEEDAQQALERLERLWPHDRPRYWLVVARAFHGDPHGHLRQALQQRYALDLQRVDAPGVEVYRESR